jgi:hypothetical protein
MGDKALKERVRTDIFLQKQENRNMAIEDIVKALNDKYPPELVPGKAAIYKLLERNRAKWDVQDNIDEPWSLGSFRDRELPPDVIESIVRIQRELKKYSRYLTHRRVLWIVCLHPYLFPVLENTFPNDTAQNEVRLLQIASFYSRLEQLALLKGKSYADTRVLDNAFIFSQDFSFETYVRIWLQVYVRYSDGADKLPSKSTSKSVHLPVARDTSKVLNELKNLIALTSGGIDNEKKILDLVREYPQVRSNIEQWLAFSLRKEIL